MSRPAKRHDPRYDVSLPELTRELKQLVPSSTEAADAWIARLPANVQQAFHGFVDSIVESQGGEGAVTAQMRAHINYAARTHLIIEIVDSYLFSQPNLPAALINRSRKMLYRIVEQRMALVEAQGRAFERIGLDRKEAAPIDLNAYLKGKYGGGVAKVGGRAADVAGALAEAIDVEATSTAPKLKPTLDEVDDSDSVDDDEDAA